MSSYICNEKFV